MDQLKEQFAVMQKHGFWIGVAVVTLGSIGVWWVATSSLIEERDKQISTLDSANSSISTINSSIFEHPNDDSHRVMEQLVKQEEVAVAEAWTSQYERQQNILVWPTESLDDDFIARVKPLYPIETHFSEYPVPQDQEIESRYLEAYRDYIGSVLPIKAEIVGAEWKADFSAASSGMEGGFGSEGGGYGMGMEGGYGSGEGSFGMGMEGGSGSGGMMGPSSGRKKKQPLVRWDGGSQEDLLRDLFPWRGRRPTTLEVLYSQENLWVMTQLLQIISDVNGNITQPFQARIHQIERLSIGRTATRATGLISPVTAGGASGTGMDGSMGMGGGMGMGMGGGMEMGSGGGMEMGSGGGMEMGIGGSGEGMDGMGSGMGGGGAERPDPLENRYVDSSYEPIEASRVRQAMSAENQNPEDAFLTVAKRLPVMLRVKMDQRQIPRLLAACGNAPLMVEVRQVRINPVGGGNSGGSGMGMPGGMAMGGGSGSGGGMGIDGGLGGREGGDDDEDYGGGMMLGSGGGSGASFGAAMPRFPLEMSVEIYGIIHIYNPPVMQKLGVDQVDSSTVVEGQSMGEQPLDEPATQPLGVTVGDGADAAPPADGNAADAVDPNATGTDVQDPAESGNGGNPTAGADDGPNPNGGAANADGNAPGDGTNAPDGDPAAAPDGSMPAAPGSPAAPADNTP